MLKIANLFYCYQSRATNTLKNVNLNIAPGEMLLLAGPSGCGKSTLIKAVSGLLGDGEQGELKGSIYLAGEDITQAAPEHIGLLAGTVYQSPDDQLFAMTVADEVAFALENRGVEPEVVQCTVRDTLARVGLAGFEKYSIHQLSGGQRQRLALASILVTKPKLLILDEPVSQMNPAGVKEFMDLLLKLNHEEGITVLMIEHRVNELYKYFKRLAVMNSGSIVYDGAMEEAWSFLAELEQKTPTGVREPQNVKLCKLLGLKQLSAETKLVTEQIKEFYSINSSIDNIRDTVIKQEQLLMEEVAFRYPGAEADTLPYINLCLYKYQITALMGFNGAGKSTLLNLLGGLTRPTKGKIYLEAKPLTSQLGKIGYLRQEPDLMLLADTVEEELSWKNKELTDAERSTMLNKLQLAAYAKDFPLALSKGQRLRVVLGAMLAKKPQLLLLDEPTTGQDEQCLTEISGLLQEYKAQGGTILICTHDIELASHIADRVLVLKNGDIIADDVPQVIFTNSQLLHYSGLSQPPMLEVSTSLEIPLCITPEEVKCYVR